MGKVQVGTGSLPMLGDAVLASRRSDGSQFNATGGF